MKPALIVSILSVVIAGLLLTNCNPASKNLMAVNYPVIIPPIAPTVIAEIATARKEINSDFQKFIASAYLLLEENETSINKIENKSGQLAVNSENKNDKQITCLLTENNKLRTKLDTYVQSGSGNWRTFETEFILTLNDLETTSEKLQINSK